MKVTIDEVQLALNLIMDSIKERGITEVEITEDYFWSIVKDQLYKMESQPKKLTVGSLQDDIEEIRKINNKEYSPVGHNLQKVTSLIRYISENVS